MDEISCLSVGLFPVTCVSYFAHSRSSLYKGLCIELWKVTKVVQINIDRENLIAGIIPRISFVDRPSYESSTKEYDMVSRILHDHFRGDTRIEFL